MLISQELKENLYRLFSLAGNTGIEKEFEYHGFKVADHWWKQVSNQTFDEKIGLLLSLVDWNNRSHLRRLLPLWEKYLLLSKEHPSRIFHHVLKSMEKDGLRLKDGKIVRMKPLNP